MISFPFGPSTVSGSLGLLLFAVGLCFVLRSVPAKQSMSEPSTASAMNQIEKLTTEVDAGLFVGLVSRAIARTVHRIGGIKALCIAQVVFRFVLHGKDEYIRLVQIAECSRSGGSALNIHAVG